MKNANFNAVQIMIFEGISDFEVLFLLHDSVVSKGFKAASLF